MVNKIAVPLDGSSLAERALPYAVALARATVARLVLLRVILAPALSMRPEEENDASAYLRVAAEKTRRQGVSAQRRLYWRYLESVGRAINGAVKEEAADLVVMSTHGRGGLRRWIYGSAADEVLRAGQAPVLLVSAACERRWPPGGPQRLLVALDGSVLAEAGLRLAENLADATGSHLLLLRVVEPPTYPYGGEAYGYPSLDLGAQRDQARAELERTAARLRAAGRDVEAATEIGLVAPTIARVAREREADLIAMATHGHGGLARVVLGSVATSTLQQANVPLLVVRPAALSDEKEQPHAAGEQERERLTRAPRRQARADSRK